MFDRIQYRLWKHLDRRFGSGTAEGGGDLAAVRRDVEDIRTLLLSQLCAPGLAEGIRKFQVPEGERGNAFADYLRDTSRAHDRIRTLVADEQLVLAEALSSYQSDKVSAAEIEEAFVRVIGDFPEVEMKARARLLHFLAERADVTGSIEAVCDATLTHPLRDAALDPYAWLQAACAYRVLGKDAKAQEALRAYLRVHGAEGIAEWPALAEFAESEGLRDAAPAASVFRDVMRLTAERRFEKAIGGKRVALVGSGPQLRGTGRGAEIDAYDIVVRMNHYNLTDSLVRDYGRKTDAWIRGIDLMDEFKGREKGAPAYSLLTYAFYVSPVSRERLALFRRQLDEGHVIQAMTAEDYRDILRRTGLHHPSGGARFACYLKKVNPTFTLKDCFAFSFLESDVKPWYRADGTLFKTPHHNLAAEQKPLQAILAPGK